MDNSNIILTFTIKRQIKKVMKRLIFLAKLGIVESTNESGEYDIQRIDNPQGFKEANDLSFLPELLESDEVAKAKFKSLTHSQLESIS